MPSNSNKKPVGQVTPQAATTQVSVLNGCWKTVRDMADDVEVAVSKLGRDLALVKAKSALVKLKEASLELMEAEQLDR